MVEIYNKNPLEVRMWYKYFLCYATEIEGLFQQLSMKH